MKKNLSLLFALLCTITFFTACSDDEKGGPDLPVNEEFKGDKLALIFNGESLTDKAVNLTQLNNSSAVIALKQLIPGEDSLVVNLTASEPATRAFADYDFKGDITNADRQITVTGSLVNGILKVDVKHIIKDTKIIGKWYTYVKLDMATYEMLTSLHLDIVNDTDKAYLPAPGWGKEISGSELPSYLGLIGMMLPQLLVSVELTNDGKLIATYYANMTDKNNNVPPVIEDKIVKYSVNNGYIYVKPDLTGLLPVSQTRADFSINDILGMLNVGIPLKYTITEDGSFKAYVDKDMMLPFMPLIESFGPMLDIEYPELIDKGELPKTIKSIVPVIKNAEKAEVGLQLQNEPYES